MSQALPVEMICGHDDYDALKARALKCEMDLHDMTAERDRLLVALKQIAVGRLQEDDAAGPAHSGWLCAGRLTKIACDAIVGDETDSFAPSANPEPKP